MVYAKGMFRDPKWMEFARWNAISRIEVDRAANGARYIVVHGEWLYGARYEQIVADLDRRVDVRLMFDDLYDKLELHQRR